MNRGTLKSEVSTVPSPLLWEIKDKIRQQNEETRDAILELRELANRILNAQFGDNQIKTPVEAPNCALEEIQQLLSARHGYYADLVEIINHFKKIV